MPHSTKAFRRSTKDGSICCNLNAQLKTHKAAGQSGYLGRVLRMSNNSQHICSSTQDFISKLNNIKCGAADWILRLDIDDFYMCGDKNVLVQNAFLRFNGGLQNVLRKCLLFCLEHQYVYSKDVKRLFHVVCGSGMGTKVSGDLADEVLCNIAELTFAVCQHTMNKYSVRGYLRYRDDVFVVLGGNEGFAKNG